MKKQCLTVTIITIWLLLISAYVSTCLAGSQTVSSTLASAIIDQARKYLNDPTSHGGTQLRIWSDTEMLQWVNDGTMDIVARTHCLEDTETETLVADQISYALGDPFILIKHVIYNGEKALLPGNIGDIGHTMAEISGDEIGEPVYWAQWENNVVVYPAPDSDAAGNTIEVYVVDRPTDVASGANVLVPAQYDKALVYYVAAQAMKKDKRNASAAMFMGEYLAELDRYRGDFNIQPKPEIEHE